MTDSGWICLHRSLLDWEWYTDENVKALFIHCLIKANYEQKKWRGNTIKRGQFITSQDNLASELGLSRMKIRTALKKLKSTNELTIQSNAQNTVITVLNYEKYQAGNQQINQRIASEQPTSNQRVTTTNNNNNINNDNNNNIEPLIPKPKKENRATKLSDDFEVTKSMVDWISDKKIYVNILEETEAFKDYHLSRGSTFKDWKAAWRTWMRNSKKFGANNENSQRPNDRNDKAAQRRAVSQSIVDDYKRSARLAAEDPDGDTGIRRDDLPW